MVRAEAFSGVVARPVRAGREGAIEGWSGVALAARARRGGPAGGRISLTHDLALFMAQPAEVLWHVIWE